jgi:5-methylcytosine-specific restriction endonuclease McrA
LSQPRNKYLAALVAILFITKFQSRKRPRYIPSATRRAVIARDLKDEKYASRKHNIDHVWPFSKGGSNTVDNLRVIEKRKNLRKGAERPRMPEMW